MYEMFFTWCAGNWQVTERENYHVMLAAAAAASNQEVYRHVMKNLQNSHLSQKTQTETQSNVR